MHLLKKLIPHVAAIAIFALLSSIFFSPVWDGYALRQNDISQWRGASKEIADYRLLYGHEPLWTNSMFGGMPAYQVSVIHHENWLGYIDKAIKLGLPGPIGAVFMCMLGFYILAQCLRINPWLSIAGAVAFGFSTINVLYLGAGHTAKVNAISYMAPALGGVILATRGKWLLGGALFALFFGLNITANHLQMTYYLAMLVGAVVLAESIRLAVASEWKGLLKAGVALGIGAGLAVLPAACNMVTTYEYSQYTTRGKTDLTILPDGNEKSDSEKAGLDSDYILEYNFGSGEYLSLMIPDIKGGPSAPIASDKTLLEKVPREMRENVQRASRYWGEQSSTGGAFYIGAIIFVLFVFGLVFAKDWLRWPFILMTLIAFALCQKNMNGLNDFFIHHFPMYNKFRDSKMILVLVQIMAPTMALIFLQQVLFEGLFKESKQRKFLLIGAGVFTLGLVTLVASPSVAGDFLSSDDKAQFDEMITGAQDTREQTMYEEYRDSIIEVRKTLLVRDAQRSLLFVLASMGVLLLAAYNKLKPSIVMPILIVLVAADNFTVAKRYMNDEKVKSNFIHYEKYDDKIAPFEANKTDLFILEREKTSIEGFDQKANEMRALMTAKEYGDVKNKEQVDMISQFGTLSMNSNFRVLNLGNPFSDGRTSYFYKSLGGYHGAKLKRYQEIIDFHLKPEMKTLVDSLQEKQSFTVLAQLPVINMLNTRYITFNPEAAPIVNRFAAGNAWFVQNIQSVPDANAEILGLKELDIQSTALVHASFSDAARSATTAPDSTSSIVLNSYGVNVLKYTSNSTVEAPAIFSEIYYPEGWICRIDGNEVPYFRANYILRGVMIPAGQHSIEWSFEPASYNQSKSISLAGSALLLLVVLGTLGVELRRALKASV